MNALAVIEAVQKAGGSVSLSGADRLKLSAPVPLPENVVAAVRAAKPDLIAFLSRPKLVALPIPLKLADQRRMYRITYGEQPAGQVTVEAAAIVGLAQKKQRTAVEQLLAAHDPLKPAKRKSIAAIETQYSITQRALREAVIVIGERVPEIKQTPIYERAVAAEGLIAPLRGQ